MAQLIAAVATAPQVSAIGIIRMSGEGCFEALSRVFVPRSGKAVAALEDRKLTLGALLDKNGDVLDEILVTISRGPHSYTGEDTAELQCHGSPAVLSAALLSLFAAGARQAGPGEFTRRAFLNGRMDLSQAEAVIDLIEAESPEMAKNAYGQLSGALTRKIDPIYNGITDILAHFHAVLDYSDEEIPDFRLQNFHKTLTGYQDSLAALEQSYDRGQYLKKGVPAVILGSPNAGKSSLLNALAGYERAIVTDIPGTTRDTVDETLSLGGVLLRLTDTAGIRETEDTVEKIGVERSFRAAESAVLGIFICDGARDLTQDDFIAMDRAKQCPVSIAILNKSDLPQKIAPQDLPFEKVICLSAKEGTGLSALEAEISRLFGEKTPADGSILTNARQVSAVAAAKRALTAVLESMDEGFPPDCVLTDAEDALQSLGEITGRSMREDVVSRIFERFCVGK